MPAGELVDTVPHAPVKTLDVVIYPRLGGEYQFLRFRVFMHEKVSVSEHP